jgi:hypothetical protein
MIHAPITAAVARRATPLGRADACHGCRASAPLPSVTVSLDTAPVAD